MDYTKLDALAYGYSRAADKPGFLADIWGELTAEEGTRLLTMIDRKEQPA